MDELAGQSEQIMFAYRHGSTHGFHQAKEGLDDVWVLWAKGSIRICSTTQVLNIHTETITPGWEKALNDVWSRTVRTFKATSDDSALGSVLNVVGIREGGLS